MKVPSLPMPVVVSSDDGDGNSRAGCCGYSVCCFANRKPLTCCKSRTQDDDQLNTPGENFYVEVDDVATPYAGKLESLSTGDVITVQGFIHPECERFSVNICCNKEKENVEPDIALHFNPRLSQRYVVRTVRLGGRWGNEETASCFPFPFRRGEKFSIDFFVADSEFYCQVDSAHFCIFDFRTPLERVSELQVRGTGVTIDVVRRGVARSYPARPVASPSPPIVPKSEDDDSIKWENPAIGILQEGFGKGKQIVIKGKIKLLPHSFYVNLQSSVQMWPHPDIPLHINPRFMAGRKHVVIRNAWQQGSWGDEERMETSHLSPGTKFDLRINCEDDHYSVWVRENLIGIFKFRMAPDCVRAILIQGDIHVNQIYQRDTPNRMAIANDEY
ncbi:galectin-6-like isoform X2 [Arctopsyche grandis]|uniref:galectin-6-like isoform X2 n=1 Tax=Arctopsyche grandis TaxID=121162 RepID=UPI00406D690B